MKGPDNKITKAQDFDGTDRYPNGGWMKGPDNKITKAQDFDGTDRSEYCSHRCGIN
jgi:hypothetical protein